MPRGERKGVERKGGERQGGREGEGTQRGTYTHTYSTVDTHAASLQRREDVLGRAAGAVDDHLAASRLDPHAGTSTSTRSGTTGVGASARHVGGDERLAVLAPGLLYGVALPVALALSLAVVATALATALVCRRSSHGLHRQIQNDERDVHLLLERAAQHVPPRVCATTPQQRHGATE
jgi:hypothetical protein